MRRKPLGGGDEGEGCVMFNPFDPGIEGEWRLSLGILSGAGESQDRPHAMGNTAKKKPLNMPDYLVEK